MTESHGTRCIQPSRYGDKKIWEENSIVVKLNTTIKSPLSTLFAPFPIGGWYLWAPPRTTKVALIDRERLIRLARFLAQVDARRKEIEFARLDILGLGDVDGLAG